MTPINEIELFRFAKACKRLFRPSIAQLENFVTGDFSEEVKLESLLSLGRIGDIQSLKILINALSEFPDFVEPISALGYFKDSTPVKMLIERLDDPDALFKEEMVKALGEIGDPMSNRTMIELLHDEDRMIRYYASWALFKTGGRDVVQSLCGLLNDSDEWVVINVLDILSRLKDVEAIPSLVGQFEITTDERLKAIIISALSSFDEGKLLKTFDAALLSHDPRIQANAVEAISKLKVPASEMKRKLKKFYGHSNNRVRANLCIALAKSQPDKVQEEIIKMMEADDAGTRRSAAYVLSKIVLPKSREYISELIRDENFSVRKMAIQSVASFETEFAISEITPMLKDQNEWVRRKAVIVATKIAEFPSVPIIELFEVENKSTVIETLLEYFISHQMKETAPSILKRIRKEVEEELPWLIGALGHLGAEDELSKAKRFLGHARTEVFSEYYRALLYNGDASVFTEIETNLNVDKKRRDAELISWIKVAGDIGLFIREPKAFSTDMKKMLLPEVKKDLQAIEAIGIVGNNSALENQFANGVTLFENKEYSKAEEILELYLKQFPEHLECRYYYAHTTYLLGNQDKAISILEEVFKTSPSHLNAAILLGQLYFRKKMWAELINIYEQLRDLISASDKKNITKIYGALGLAYFHSKKYVEAIRALNEGLKANPRDLSSSYHLALCYYATGNLMFARDILEGLRKVLPKDSQVLKNVIDLLQRIETTM